MVPMHAARLAAVSHSEQRSVGRRVSRSNHVSVRQQHHPLWISARGAHPQSDRALFARKPAANEQRAVIEHRFRHTDEPPSVPGHLIIRTDCDHLLTKGPGLRPHVDPARRDQSCPRVATKVRPARSGGPDAIPKRVRHVGQGCSLTMRCSRAATRVSGSVAASRAATSRIADAANSTRSADPPDKTPCAGTSAMA